GAGGWSTCTPTGRDCGSRPASGMGSTSRPPKWSSAGSAPHAVQPPSPIERKLMPELKGSTTHENLKAAFAGESQANRRYLYFAQKADVEGHPDIAALFRSVAEGETGHAFGHFDFLAEVGDPVTGVNVGPTA